MIDRIVQISMPGAILFGVGAHRELPQRAKEFSAGPFLIVTDSGLIKTGVVKEIEGLMTDAGFGVHLFDEIEPDPEIEIVDRCLQKIISTEATAVIGVGGGSCLDIAKTASAMVKNEGDITDYVGIEKLQRKGLPVILLPTTSGTASEVTPIAVLSDKKQRLKIGIVNQYLYCNMAIIDPELTVSCPSHITASSGMDTLTHAIEVYTNKFTTENKKEEVL